MRNIRLSALVVSSSLALAAGSVLAATYTFPTYVPSPTTFPNTNIRNFNLTTLGTAPTASWVTATVTVAWNGGSLPGTSAQWSNEARAGLSGGGRTGTVASPVLSGTNFANVAVPTSGALGNAAPTTLTWSYTLLSPYAGGANPLFLDFGQSFFSTTTPTANANWNSVSVQLSDVLPPPLAPTGPITDLGVLTNTSNSYLTPDYSVNVATTSTSRVHWIKFQLPVGVSGTLDQFLDIDTLSNSDSIIGLYRAFSPTSAILEDSDDDDGPGGSGAGSALSYGDATPARGPIAVDAVAGNGRDGSSLGAGTYYLGVAGWASGVSFGSNYNVTGASATARTYTVNFRTNIPEPTTLGAAAVLGLIALRRKH
jgi:hypothetical protein